MKAIPCLLVATVCAIVLPWVVPGYPWLIPSVIGRTVFTFIVVLMWCALLRRRGHASFLRERPLPNAILWSLTGGVFFTFLLTLVFALVVEIFGRGLGIQTPDAVQHTMVFFAIVCFTVVTWRLLRTTYVL